MIARNVGLLVNNSYRQQSLMTLENDSRSQEWNHEQLPGRQAPEFLVPSSSFILPGGSTYVPIFTVWGFLLHSHRESPLIHWHLVGFTLQKSILQPGFLVNKHKDQYLKSPFKWMVNTWPGHIEKGKKYQGKIVVCSGFFALGWHDI